MRQGSVSQLDRLERWAPTAFLAGGLLLAGYATLNGLAAFTDTAYPAVEDVVGPGGFVLGFLGLLGLYPPLVRRSRKLARVAALLVTFGVVGFSVITVSSIGRLVGVVPDQPWSFFPILLGMVAVGMIPGYLSVALASVQAGVFPRRVSLLLALPALIFGTMAIGGLTGSATQTGAFLISSGQAVVILALGYTLRGGPAPGVPEASAADLTAG